jgi:hypothetical protein
MVEFKFPFVYGLCRTMVSNIFALGLAMMGVAFSPFDLGVVNDLCTDDLHY